MSIACSLLVWLSAVPGIAEELPTVEEIRAAVKSGFGQVHSLKAEYEFHWTAPATQAATSHRLLAFSGDRLTVQIADAVASRGSQALYGFERIFVGPDGCTIVRDIPSPRGRHRQYHLYRSELDPGKVMVGDPRQWGLFVAFQRLDRWLQKVDFKVAGRETVLDSSCIKIVARQAMPVPSRWPGPPPMIYYKLWLDPARGYMPRQIEHGSRPDQPVVRVVVDRFQQTQDASWIPAAGRYITTPANAPREVGRLLLVDRSLSVNIDLPPEQLTAEPPPGANVVDHRGFTIARYEQPYSAQDQMFRQLVDSVQQRLDSIPKKANIDQIGKVMAEASADPVFGDITTAAGRARMGLLLCRTGQMLLKLANEDQQIISAARQASQAAINIYSLWPDESLLSEAIRAIRRARRRVQGGPTSTLISYELNLRACKVLKESGSRFKAAKAIRAELTELVEIYPDNEELAMTMLRAAKDLSAADQAAGDQVLRALRKQSAGTRAGKIAAGMLRVNALVDEPLEMKFKAIDGRQVDLADMRGKVVLIHYMSITTPAAAAMAPLVEQLYRRYGDSGLEVVTISLDPDVELLRKYVSDFNISSPVYCDSKRWDSPLVTDYGVSEIPSAFLLDRTGKVRYALLQSLPEILIATLLDEPVGAKPTTSRPAATQPSTRPAGDAKSLVTTGT